MDFWVIIKRMNSSTQKGRVIIPAGRRPWPHELRVADILAMAGSVVEFIPESNTKTADIYLDGVEYEIKSPLTNKTDNKARTQKQIGKLILITKHGQIIDIKSLI